MDEVRIGETSVYVLPVVRGLPSEGPAVRNAIDAVQPDVVALSISPEEVDALRLYKGGPAGPDNFEEEVYVAGLSVWEEPVKPAPCFTEALRTATVRKARVEGIDMDESTYTDAYTQYVSAMELILQGRVQARLGRRKFRATTPQEFVLEWDKEVNRSAGFARLQREREARMASRLKEISSDVGRVLAVIEVERVKGVLAAIHG